MNTSGKDKNDANTDGGEHSLRRRVRSRLNTAMLSALTTFTVSEVALLGSGDAVGEVGLSQSPSAATGVICKDSSCSHDICILL